MNKTLSITPIKRWLPYLKSFKKEILIALILGVINGASVVSFTFLVGKAVDTMVGESHVFFQQLLTILTYLIGITLMTTISQWLIQRLSNKVAYQSVHQLRKEAFHHLNQLPISYYDKTSHGDIMSRFSNDLDFISDSSAAIFNQIFSGLTIVVISFVTMLNLSPLLTLVIVVSTFFIFLVNWLVATTSRAQFAKQQKTVGLISGFLSEHVTNQKVIKAFQYEETSQEAFDQLNQELFTVGRKAQFISSLTNPLSRFVDHLAYLSIGLIGGLLVIQETPNITIGIVTSFLLYSAQFSKPFIELSGVMTQLQTAIASLERMFNLLDEPVEITNKETPLPTIIKGHIEFCDVSFSYDKKTPLIQGFNFDVNPGETVAIVGKTGAGKSTLVNLLMAFYELDSGDILLDGVPITQYNKNEFRQLFGMVLQETWLFNGTVWDNLVFGRPNASLEEVKQACQEASIDHFIDSLPQGFDTLLGQSGLSISDGQKQLLSIARTMISQPKMLILDEATSSIDPLTEQLIQKTFLNMMVDKTSFIIAHRLSTIQSADKIMVMDQGQIVEVGTHHELLQQPTSHYSALYQAQFNS